MARRARPATRPRRPDGEADLLGKVLARHLLAHPVQLVLAVAGILLGVAVVVGIDVANTSSRRAFDLATEAVAGRASHEVTGPPAGLPEEVFRRLATAPGTGEAAPVVEGWVSALPADGGGEGDGPPGGVPVHLLGVDPFSERPFRPYLAAFSGGGDRTEGSIAGAAGRLVAEPGTVVASAATAARLGVPAGGRLELEVAGRRRAVELVALLDPADERSRRALDDLLVADVATAQEVLDRAGRLDRIDLLLPTDAAGRAAALDRLRRLLPPNARVRPAARGRGATAEMTRAFRLNLTALGGLALVCGVFLIFNTMSFAVVQRRRTLGTLRALGVTRREVLGWLLAEAAALGVVGSALGVAAGVALGRALVGLVTRTVNDLYFVVTVRELALEPERLAAIAGIGVAATVAAALWPAVEATSAPPRIALARSALESRSHRAAWRAAALGLALGVGGAVVLALPIGRAWELPAAFAALFGVIVGCALLTPVATLGLMALARRPAGLLFGVLGRLAARGVGAALSRTGVAVAALAIAVSVTVGVGVMISSFRGTVVSWLELSLGADVYVRPPGPGDRPGAGTVAPAALAAIRSIPGVGTVQPLRVVTLDTESGPLRLVALPIDRLTRGTFDLAAGDPATAWPAVERGAVLVSEPYAYRRGLAPGDRLRLPTAEGVESFPVAGVYYDYGSDQGAVLLDREVYRRAWRDEAISGVAVTAAPGTDVDRLVERLRAAAAPHQRLVLRSNRALREAALEVFDRTFAVTRVLRLLAGLVAAIGVLSALLALQLERTRELGVLRANGLTPGQVWHLVLTQTGLMGLAAGLLSLPVGVVLASLMIHVINRRSFGWTIRMDVPPEILLQALGLALAAALAAGLYPAWRMAATSPAEALREE